MTGDRAAYARKLALLCGDTFEEEVVIALQQTFTGFQRVPDKPNGDGGLDGLSHNFSRAYCCYGLELQPGPGTLAAALRSKIAAKFKEDLRRLLELEQDKKKLLPKPNKVLPLVLGDPPFVKLSTITLVVNVFEDNRLIGDLRAAFTSYLTTSDRRFVDDACELAIWGPVDLANNAAINAHLLLRLEHPGLFQAMKTAAEQAEQHEPADQDKFNSKFDDLEKRLPKAAQQIAELRSTFKLGWSKSILLNQQMAATLPNLHEEFDASRKAAATDAIIASNVHGVDPFELLEKSREGLRKRVADLAAGGLPLPIRDELVEAETGRLIGECPLDWRSQT